MAIADEEIKRKIVDQLYSNARIDSSKIKVFVEDGNVTLSGTVTTFTSLQTASNAALTISGITSLDNRIKVERPPTGTISREEEIASRIERLMDWNPELEASDISVSVKNGCVTLEGSVDVYWKKFLAE